MARSAALLVGSTPGTRTKVQSAGASVKISRHVAAVGGWKNLRCILLLLSRLRRTGSGRRPCVRGGSGTVLLTERYATMYSEAEVARFLEMTTSSINRLAISEERPEFRKYRNAL